ncbi:Bug family tripartite tricarboxylate transporter substrate binding protein [Pseudorhodoplanes sp.]|uniref:Bug family tripartite tricarboxylate transporter substrate binding protein n=1 Tax=Pseudorhodoplanes sp. TaxID=1934341 RepID=UPI003D0A68E0
MIKIRGLRAAFAVLALVAAAGAAAAQDYPNRAVKIIVPFPAGGTADAVPRLVGDWLSKKWGQPVIIENPTGAAGNIGSEQAFRADPDGYTLLSAPPPPLVINQNLYKNLNFDASKFEPIIVMAQVPNGVIVNPSKVSAKTLPEFLAYLKANPGKVTSATQGNGTTSHLTSEMLQLMAGVKVQHVPYRGTAPALQDLVAGNVDFMCDNLGVSLPLVQSGKLRLLAVATAKPMASLPNVPTVAQTLPGFESVAWYAVVAPPGTPKAITEKINADINEALRDPAIQERLKKLSAEVVGGSTAETAKYLGAEVDRWNKVIKDANVKIGG